MFLTKTFVKMYNLFVGALGQKRRKKIGDRSTQHIMNGEFKIIAMSDLRGTHCSAHLFTHLFHAGPKLKTLY